MNKHILLISYVFPPYPTVGSRRWTKFAKYLARMGFEIHVIAAKNPFKEKSLWGDDIKHENIDVHYISRRFPRILILERKYLWQRVIAKMLSCTLKLFVKGMVHDFALFWKRPLQKEAIRLIKKYKIKNVITTGPPFRVLYYTALLKPEFPNINLISDIRDNWLDGKLYCLNNFSSRTLKYETRMENCVVLTSDYVTFTDENITSGFKDRYLDKTNSNKFITLPHAYDPESYKYAQQSTTKKDNKKIRFVFGGSIPMKDIKPVILPFFDSLKLLKRNRPEIYNRLLFIFYIKQLWVCKILKKYDLDIISLHDPLSEQRYFQSISQADFLMVFLPDHLNNYKITKFPEYLPLKKPIVVFSNVGKTSRYVVENKIGYAFTPDNYYNSIISLIEEYDNGRAIFNPNFNYEEFSFENITKKLETLFK